MVKTRPVVVVSRTNRASRLCTVVPLSGTVPAEVHPWHHCITSTRLPASLRRHGADSWAKCDCLTTVSFDRLDRVKIGKDPRTGRRLYDAPRISDADLVAIRRAICAYLDLPDLPLEP